MKKKWAAEDAVGAWEDEGGAPGPVVYPLKSPANFDPSVKPVRGEPVAEEGGRLGKSTAVG